MHTRTPFLALLAFLLVPAAPAPAQEGEEAVRDELTELFDAVHKDLKTIDRLLLEADGREATGREADAVEGIRRLLEEARAREASVVKAIEEILQKAPG